MLTPLVLLAIGLLIFGSWLIATRNRPIKDERPKSLAAPCPNCNGTVVVWYRPAKRPSAWVGDCRRCGLARIDVVDSVELEVA